VSAAQIDLADLQRERPAPRLAPPRRTLRIVLPLVVVAAAAALFGESLVAALRGAREVRIVRPTPVAAGALATAAGGVLAQAAGWVEPDPFPLRVTALTAGVVAEVLVQESDVVAAGDPVARLVDADARLALEQAEAARQLAQGEEQGARAELAAAREAFEAAIEVQAARASAAAALAGARAEVELRRAAQVQARARLALAEDEVLVQRELESAGVAGPRQVEIALSRVEEARGELAGLEAELAAALARVGTAQAEDERSARDLELRIEERRRVAAGEADLAAAEGRLAETRVGCDTARLALERTVVRAPGAGVVLERLALPGSSVGGADAAVATLFDPASLRVRVDVPQQDLAHLAVGQEVQLESDARPGAPYAGRVLRIVQRADVQKVTLQAHVRVLEPDGLLRPEMLVQARFLAPREQAPRDEGDAPAATGVAIPARLVDADGGVWVLDPVRGTAVRRTPELGARDGENVIVRAGLDLSDKLLDAEGEPLREGERVREARR
jgi:HlyD family secretion protein